MLSSVLYDKKKCGYRKLYVKLFESYGKINILAYFPHPPPPLPTIGLKKWNIKYAFFWRFYIFKKKS